MPFPPPKSPSKRSKIIDYWKHKFKNHFWQFCGGRGMHLGQEIRCRCQKFFKIFRDFPTTFFCRPKRRMCCRISWATCATCCPMWAAKRWPVRDWIACKSKWPSWIRLWAERLPPRTRKRKSWARKLRRTSANWRCANNSLILILPSVNQIDKHLLIDCCNLICFSLLIHKKPSCPFIKDGPTVQYPFNTIFEVYCVSKLQETASASALRAQRTVDQLQQLDARLNDAYVHLGSVRADAQQLVEKNRMAVEKIGELKRRFEMQAKFLEFAKFSKV